jgi:hypothetical protein
LVSAYFYLLCCKMSTSPSEHPSSPSDALRNLSVSYEDDAKSSPSRSPPTYTSPSKSQNNAVSLSAPITISSQSPNNALNNSAVLPLPTIPNSSQSSNPPAFVTLGHLQACAQRAEPWAPKPIIISSAALQQKTRRSTVSISEVESAVNSFEQLFPGFGFDRKSITARALARGNKDRQILAAERQLAKLKREKDDLEKLREADRCVDDLYAEADDAADAHKKYVSTMIGVNKRHKAALKEQYDIDLVERGETRAPEPLKNFALQLGDDGAFKLVRIAQ